MKIAHIINVSGGKDSAATALIAQKWLADRDRKGVFVFADTGHEARETYDWLDYFAEKLGQPIRRISANFDADRFARRRANIRAAARGQTKIGAKTWRGESPATIRRVLRNMKPTGNAFTDLAKLQGGFPAPRMRFCTEHLKIRPLDKQVIKPLIADGFHIINWLGVRRDESRTRRTTPRLVWWKGGANFYPIREWSKADVFSFLAENGVEPNPLYAKGFKRVGCAPCIYAREEAVKFADIAPENIERVKTMEEEVRGVSRTGASSFFSAQTQKEKAYVKENGRGITIEMVVENERNKVEANKKQGDMFSLCDEGYCE